MTDIQTLEELDYESLPGGTLAHNLLAGAFAGIMVCFDGRRRRGVAECEDRC